MSKQKNGVLWLWFLLTAVATAFIFCNALQTGDDSIASSDAVIAWLAPVLETIDRLFGDADWHFLIRKAAHVTEYALLGAFSVSFARTVAQRKGRPFTVHALLYALLVAMTDEFLQGFVARTSAVYDIWIDFAGVLLGAAVATLLRWLIRKPKKKGGRA